MLWVQVVFGAALIAASGDTNVRTLRVFALSGDAPSEVRRKTERAVQNGIDDETLEVTLEAAPIEDATVVFDCSANEPSCIRSIASALAADLLLHGRLRRGSDDQFELLLTLARNDGRVLATTETKFDEATLEQTVDREVRDLVARGMGSPVRTGRLTITSRPSGAGVFRSGALIGTTPAELELPFGRHLLELKSGERVERHVVQIEADMQSVDVVFKALDTTLVVTTTEPPTTGGSHWTMPGVTMGVGAVAVVVGSALLASARSQQNELDDGVAMLASPPTSAERTRLMELDNLASSGGTNATIGYIALGVGVTAIVAGLVWGVTSSDEPSATAIVTPTGAGVRW